jgi:hypothetical protein
MVLVAHAAEQLDGQDVRVAVDDAAHDERAPLRAQARQLAQARDEMLEDPDVAREPGEVRRAEPPVGRRHEAEGRDTVDADVPDGADARHRALAQGARRLHDAIRDAPREIVLEERPALTHDVPVALPANQARRSGDERVVPDRDIREDGERPCHEHERDHHEQHRQSGRQRSLAIGGFHQRHEPADEEWNHGIEQRHGEARREHGRVPALRLLYEVPIERAEPFGWRADVPARRRGNVEVDDLHGRVSARLEPLPRRFGSAGDAPAAAR